VTVPPAHVRADQRPRILLIGNDELSVVTQRALRDAGATVTNLRDPTDPAIRTALRHEVDRVVVISKDDHISLRSALVAEGVRPGVPLVVTVFDRDVAVKLEGSVRNVRVISMADIVVPSIAAACLDHSPLSLHRTPAGFKAVRPGAEGPEIVSLDLPARRPGARTLSALGSLLRPYELSAKILMGGLLGFIAILVVDALVTMAFLHEPFVEAIYTATKTIVTVGPNPEVDRGPSWFKLFSAATMLAGLAFTALFTAGVVNRLIDRRLIAIVGRRVAPRNDHVMSSGSGRSACACACCCASSARRCWRSSPTATPTTSRVPRTTAYLSSSAAAAAATCSSACGPAARGRSPPSPPTRSRTSRSSSQRTGVARICARCCAPAAGR
jgi:hypothetical protein